MPDIEANAEMYYGPMGEPFLNLEAPFAGGGRELLSR